MKQATTTTFKPFREGLFFILLFTLPAIGLSQQLKMTDFVIFGGGGTCPTCAVQMGPSTVVNGGSVGSYKFVTSTGTINLTGNIYSGGTVQLAGSNTVSGKITAGNSQGLSLLTNVLTVGSTAKLGGNIDALASVSVTSGTVSGKVTHPSGSNYSGPAPAGGNVVGTPTIPTMPSMPAITNFPAFGVANITNTQTIVPGPYKDVILGSNSTLTLSGPGVYIFKSLTTNGPNSQIVFDFKNTATGNFFIYVYSDVILNKNSSSLKNGGSATRIYSETHGTGSTNTSDNTAAWYSSNGSSGSGNVSIWYGSVWAPYGGIRLGSPTGPTSTVTGALWSGVKVNILGGVFANYAPFPVCTNPPSAKAGPDKQLDCTTTSLQLDGTASTPGLQYSWTAINGGAIDANGTTLTPTVSKKGTYILTVTDPSGSCVASDTALVTFNPCIFPFYPPLQTGKTNEPIGSELSSLYTNFGQVLDSAKTIFILNGNTVMIEVIARQGQKQNLWDVLKTAPYGLTDTIPNGTNSLILTGKYPILNLKKLDSLPTLIDYVRPLFPAVYNGGIATTQGDKAMRTDFLRNGYNLNGDSIKVGVLSDSYNTLAGDPAATDVANGDLPGAGNPVNTNPVQVLAEYPFGVAGDEGRAMLEIIHDIAPKAETFLLSRGPSGAF